MTKIKDKERLLKAVREKATVKVKSLSRVRLFATPGTIVYQAPQPMEFSKIIINSTVTPNMTVQAGVDI